MQLILSADDLKDTLFFVPLSETALNTDKCSIREICLGPILSPLENRLFRWKTLVRPTSSYTDGKHFRGLPIIPMETLHRTLMECNFRTYRQTYTRFSLIIRKSITPMESSGFYSCPLESIGYQWRNTCHQFTDFR